MAFAVLYLPLIDEFGGSRGEVAAVQSALFLVSGFTGPLVGWAFDRLGPRRLFQWSGVLAAAALVAASRATSLPLLVLTYGLLAGLGLAALGSQTNMTLAALWYPEARGRAIAVVDLGTGFGAFCFIPLAQALVATLGWRATLLVWAALLLVVVPLNALQRLPEGAGAARGASGEARGGWTVAGAVRSAPFWWLAATRFFGACAFPLMNVHMVAFAVGQGIAAATAATALGAVSLVSLAGRLTTGILCDRLGRAPALTLTYASAAVGIGCLVLLSATGTPWWLVLYVAFYGMAQGSSGIVASARAADLFAGASFGAIWGWLSLAVGPGEALGAWLGGEMFDVSGSYLPAFGFVVLALAAGVLAIWRIQPAAPPGALRR
ncbi:MAG: MFS transporter [Candidatus Rokubacteria bacterium]|nr:MFS transporter [Candidatus Rokubacteria bacterium]